MQLLSCTNGRGRGRKFLPTEKGKGAILLMTFFARVENLTVLDDWLFNIALR